MAGERSDRIFEIGREASEKYDYFMAGLAAALTAYVGQSFTPSVVAWPSAEALEAFAILVLTFSVVSGIKRIQVSNHLLRVNHAVLSTSEQIGKLEEMTHASGPFLNTETGDYLDAASARKLVPILKEKRKSARDLLKKLMGHADFASRARDLLLLAGFLILVLARILKAVS